MMKFLLATLPLVIATLTPRVGYCSSVLPAAHVLAFGTYGNGNIWITLDRPLDQPGCSIAAIELPANGLANKTVLAAAAVAVATGASVFVQVDGCLGPAATFTGARDGTAFGVNKL